MGKKCRLKEALSMVRKRGFNPIGECTADNQYYVLSDWSISVLPLKITLRQGFPVYRELCVDAFNPGKVVSFLFYDDTGTCTISSMSMRSLLLKEFAINEDDLMRYEAVLTVYE